MRVSDTVAIGLALRKRRKELGYTQQFLSDVTGLSVSFISEVENGKETAEVGKVIRYISFLGLNVLLEER
mgnify:CR=1 FL=1